VNFFDQIIRLRAQFPDYTMKKVRLDNVSAFTSRAFNDYYMSLRLLLSIILPMYIQKMV